MYLFAHHKTIQFGNRGGAGSNPCYPGPGRIINRYIPLEPRNAGLWQTPGYDPPQGYLELYDGAEIPKPLIGDWSHFLDSVQGGESVAFGNFGREHALESRKHYYANITFIEPLIFPLSIYLSQLQNPCLKTIIFLKFPCRTLQNHQFPRS